MANLDPAILAQLADGRMRLINGRYYQPVYNGGDLNGGGGESASGHPGYLSHYISYADGASGKQGSPFDTYDPSGAFTGTRYMDHDTLGSMAKDVVSNPGFLMMAGAGLGMAGGMAGQAAGSATGIAPGAAGAAGAAGPGMAGWGMDLGMEGLAGTVGGGGAGAAGAGGLGAAGAAGAGGAGGFGSTLATGASSLMPTTAGGWGSLIGPAASLGSSLYGASAAKDAAGIQAQSADSANALQREMFNKQIELQEPFRQGGLSGMNRLLDLYGLSKNTSADGYGSAMRDFSMADYQADPGLEFRRQEGEQGLTRGAAASGMLGSGKYLKDAMRFNSGLASQEYGKAFDRFQVNRTNKIAPLQSLMGSAQTSANTLGQAAQNYGANVGNNLIGAGNARAAGTMGAANAIAGGVGTGWNMYQQNQMMNMLQPKTGGQ